MSQNRLLAYLVTLFSFLALVSFALSPFFAIKSIEFQGLNVLKEEDLTSIINPYNNSNILFLDSRKLDRELQMNITYIESVSIEKKYPDRIVIKVKEREALAMINNNGKYLTFSSKGYIIEEGSLKRRVLVPELKGLGYTLNNRNITFSPILEKVIQALEELSPDKRSIIINITYNEEEDIITAYTNEFQIYFGQAIELNDKFKVLESILSKIQEQNLEVEYVNLRILKKPVVKLK